MEKANFDGINERMTSFDWNSMMMVIFTADALRGCFSQILQCAVNEFVPITVCHNLSRKRDVFLHDIQLTYVRRLNANGV